MKWIFFGISSGLLLAAGLVADSYFAPGKAAHNLTTWLGFSLLGLSILWCAIGIASWNNNKQG